MPIETPQPDHAIHAVFCVCATPDVATAATEACAELPSVEFVGEFHDYFSPERRPQLSPALKTASVCIAIVDCDRDPEMALSTMERLRSMALKNLSVIAYATPVCGSTPLINAGGGVAGFSPNHCDSGSGLSFVVDDGCLFLASATCLSAYALG